MPVPAGAVGGGGQPSCLQRIQLGFMMGCCVGVASGIIFGGFQGWRMGFRGRELVHQLGKTMAQSGGTFGTFMAIGTGVRCWISKIKDNMNCVKSIRTKEYIIDQKFYTEHI